MFLSRSISLVTCLSAFLLSGCLRYEETITVDANNKGSLTFILERPEQPVLDKLDRLFSQENLAQGLPPGIKLDYQETRRDNRLETKAHYDFDDIGQFVTWAARTDLPFNQISVSRHEHIFEYTRRFGPFSQEELEAAKQYAGDMTAVFKLTGPGRLETNNATRIEDRTAIWEFKAPALLSQSNLDLRARYEYGSAPWFWGVVVILTVLLASCIILWRLRKKRKSN